MEEYSQKLEMMTTARKVKDLLSIVKLKTFIGKKQG